MNKFLLAGAGTLLLAAALQAQKPTPRPTPEPRPAFIDDNQLLETGGFERPRVWRPSSKEEGGDPVKSGSGEWIHFVPNRLNSAGQIVAGLTNDVARTGKQSLFVRFDHAKTSGASYSLISGLIPVKPSESYHISIWGKIDPKSPLTIDQRLPVLRLQTDFYQANRETQTGESDFKVQPIPGTLNRPPFFTPNGWTEYYADLTSPDDAAYIKIAWSWGLVSGEGECTGTIYFDDAGIAGARPDPDATPDPNAPAPPAPADPSAPPAPPAPAPDAK